MFEEVAKVIILVLSTATTVALWVGSVMLWKLAIWGIIEAWYSKDECDEMLALCGTASICFITFLTILTGWWILVVAFTNIRF